MAFKSNSDRPKKEFTSSSKRLSLNLSREKVPGCLQPTVFRSQLSRTSFHHCEPPRRMETQRTLPCSLCRMSFCSQRHITRSKRTRHPRAVMKKQRPRQAKSQLKQLIRQIYSIFLRTWNRLQREPTRSAKQSILHHTEPKALGVRERYLSTLVSPPLRSKYLHRPRIQQRSGLQKSQSISINGLTVGFMLRGSRSLRSSPRRRRPVLRGARSEPARRDLSLPVAPAKQQVGPILEAVASGVCEVNDHPSLARENSSPDDCKQETVTTPDSVRKGNPTTIRGCQPKMSFFCWPIMPSRFLLIFSVLIPLAHRGRKRRRESLACYNMRHLYMSSISPEKKGSVSSLMFYHCGRPTHPMSLKRTHTLKSQCYVAVAE